MSRMMSVRDLVSDPLLGTWVVAGAAGLDRPIQWAHSCEMQQPWNWLGAEDLLMTIGHSIPAEDAAQVEWIERLADLGLSGVAVGHEMFAPPLSAAMCAAADRRGLPLLYTALETPFISLAHAVIESAQRQSQRRLDRVSAIYELLREASENQASVTSFAGSLSRLLEGVVDVRDSRTARSLLRPAPDISAESTPVAELSLPGPRESTLVVGPGGESGLEVLRHVAAAMALMLSWEYAGRERARRLGASTLAHLLDSTLSETEAHARLSERGLEKGPWIMLACPVDGGDDHRLHNALDDPEIPHVMLTRSGTTYVLAAANSGAARALLEDGYAGRLGTSDEFGDLRRIGPSAREAAWALHRAQAQGVDMVSHGEESTGTLFVPSRTEDARVVSQRVLGELADYDADHGSDLVRTLQVFLEADRSWQVAAERLDIHRQSLGYRIGRIESITGRSLKATSDVAELWLALQSAHAVRLAPESD